MARTRVALMLIVLTLAPFAAAFLPSVGAQTASILFTPTPALVNGYWANASIDVALSCSQEVETCDLLYRLDEGDATGEVHSYNGTPVRVASEGPSYRLMAAFNAQEPVFDHELPFGIDLTRPSFSELTYVCDTDGAAGWCLDLATVFVTVPDDDGSPIVEVVCSINGDVVPCNDPCPDCPQMECGQTCATQESTCTFGCGFTVSTEGQNDIRVSAKDEAGNTHVASLTVPIDATAPTAPALACAPAESLWCLSFAQLTPASDAASGIATESCAVDNVTTPCAAGDLAREGVFFFRANATDAAGHNASFEGTFQVDTLAPLLTITHDCAPVDGWCADTFAFDMTAADDGSGLSTWSCDLDDVPLDACEGNVTEEGTHTLHIVASDVAGNTNSTSLTLGIDRSLPTVNLSYACGVQGSNGWCHDPASVHVMVEAGEGSPIVEVVCWLEGAEVPCDAPCNECVQLVSCEMECLAPAQTCSSGCVFTLADEGSHDVAVYARDEAGHERNETLVVPIDATAPVAATLTCTPAEGSDWCDTFAVLTPASDATSGIASASCLVDGVAIGCIAGSLERQGTFTFTSQATDAAGHAAPNVSSTLSVDTRAPIVSLQTACTIPGVDVWCRGSLTYNMTATDDGSGLTEVVCTLDGGALDGCAGQITAQGLHVLTIQATDASGRTASAEATVGLDTVAPFYEIPRQVAIGEDDGTTRVTFHFSEPMARATTEAAAVGATGWTAAWDETGRWLNLTAPAGLPEGVHTNVSIGTAATDIHGVPLDAGEARHVITRGPRDYLVTPIPYGFVNITGNGTDTGIYCDDHCEDVGTPDCAGRVVCGAGIEIPFGFTYYGRTYYELNISPNGFITLGRGDCLTDYTPDPFPNTCENLVAAFWEDLDTRSGTPGPNGTALDRVLYHTFGEAPERTFVVSWSAVHHYYMTEPLATFQIQLHEGSNAIDMHYERAMSDDGDHLIGIINTNGSRHTTYAFLPMDLVESAIRFSGNGTVGDVTPPTVTVSGDLGLLATPNATITYTFSEPMDQAETLLALENATGWTTAWSGNGTVLTLQRDDLPLGTTTITLTGRASDLSGVRIPAAVARTLMRDETAPQLDVSLDPAEPTGLAGWYSTAVNATLVATDAHTGVDASTYEHSFDGEHWIAGATAELPEGESLLRGRVRDHAGLLGEASTHVRVDRVPPQLGIAFEPQEGALVAILQATDASSGVNASTYEHSLDGESWAPGSSFTVPPGTSVVHGRVRDEAGNTQQTSTEVGVDAVPPQLEILLDPAHPTGLEGWYNTTVDATLVATDHGSGVNGSSYEHSLDGETWTPGANVTLPEGETLLRGRVRDHAGNLGEANVTVRIDQTPPTVRSSNATINDTAGAWMQFNFSEPMDTDATSAAVENATGWTLTWSEDRTVLLADRSEAAAGTTTLTILPAARDAHGVHLAASHARSITLSARTPPSPVPLPPPDAPEPPTDLVATLTGTTATLTWAAPTQTHGAPVTSYQVHVDGVLASEVVGNTYTVSGLARGATHAFEVRAVNSAGASAPASTSVDVLPTSSLRIPVAGPGGWHAEAPELAFTTDPPGATILVDIGDGETPYGPGFTLPPGETLLRWRATAGGLSEEPQEVELAYDPDAPAITDASVTPDALTVGESVRIAARVADAHSGVASVVARIDGADVELARQADGSYAGRATPGEGQHDVEIVATDGAGHVARASAGRVDATVPEPADPEPTGNVTGGAIPLESTSSGGTGGASPPTAGPLGVTPTPDTSGAPEDEPEPEPEPTPPAVVIDDPTDAGARGIITVRVSDFPQLERLRIVLVAPNGTETLLSEGQEVTTWDTTVVSDGYYTIEARLGPATLSSTTLTIQSSHANGETLATLRVLVRNEFAPPVETAAVIAGAALFTAATHAGLSAAAAGASGSATSATLSGASGFHPLDFLREVAVDAGQDKLRDKTKDRAAIDRKRRLRSVIVAVAGILILGALWAFAETDGWSGRAWLLALPLVGTAAALVTLMKYTMESALAWVTHARPRVRLWVAGTLSLALSSIIFRNPFGYPAWVDETDESESRNTWKMQALRAGATIAGAAAFILPFLAVAPVASWSFVSIGVLIALTNLATSAMPFGPLPGKDIWRWNKWAAVGVAIAGFAIYVAYSAALAPMWLFWAIGLAGAAGYAGSLVYFRRAMGPRARRVPVQVAVPVQDMDAASHDTRVPAGKQKGERKVGRKERRR